MEKCPGCGTWDVIRNGHAPNCEFKGMDISEINHNWKNFISNGNDISFSQLMTLSDPMDESTVMNSVNDGGDENLAQFSNDNA